MSGALRFGRYETLFRIAAGGMAEVFAARLDAEGGFRKLVAVKRILPTVGEDEGFTKMFLDEARIAAHVTSPHVVQTLDMGRGEDGTPYIVQELVLGTDLNEILRAQKRTGAPLPIGVAVEILAQAATGLHDAHEARTPDGRPLELVHRDVSPHNLMVGADGRVRLADFGIARVAIDRMVATRTGTVKGKLAYFAPEQVVPGPIDRRTDLFALGIVAWECLTGRRLFHRHSPAETLEAVREAPIPSLVETRPDVPEGVERLVLGALERDPGRRPIHARAFGDGLRRAAREAGYEPSDLEVAAHLRELEPPRLTQLAERLRQVSLDPGIVTLADIEIDDDERSAQRSDAGGTARASLRNEPEPAPRRDDAMTVLQRPAGRLEEAPTVLLGRRAPEESTLVHERRSLLVPAVMVALGLLLGLAAVLVILLR